MSFIPSAFRVLTGAIVLLGASLFLNLSVDTENSHALLAMGAQAKEKCIKIDGKRVCREEGAKKKNAKKKKDDDDDGDDDDDDDGKGEKKTGDDDTGLTECTVQQPGGGGGCKTGLKRVCETLKSGKKCCGCVPDPNAKPVEKTTGGDQPQALLVFACMSDVEAPDGRIIANRRAGIRAASDAEARIIYMTSLPKGVLLRGAVTCTRDLNP